MPGTFQCDTLQGLHAANKVKGVAKDVVAPAHEHHGRQRIGMQHGCHQAYWCSQSRAPLFAQHDIIKVSKKAPKKMPSTLRREQLRNAAAVST